MKAGIFSVSDFIRRRPSFRRWMPGIRFKISFQIGVFIAVILSAATYINYLNQSSILENSFNNETENSLNYINPVINQIDSVSSNLLFIEEMKIRINEKNEDLKKYKIVTRRRKISATNSIKSFVKKLGVSIRYDYFYKSRDTYYSTYISSKDITDLEKKTADQLKQSDGNAVNPKDFKILQDKAKKVAVIQKRINRLEYKNDQNNENHAVDSKLASERKKLAVAYRIFRRNLNRYYNYQLKKIEEIGIFNSNIRIITYSVDGNVNSDTGTYFKKSLVAFADLFASEKFKKEKSDFFSRSDIFATVKPHEYDYTTGKRFFHVRYVPVYKNPATSERLVAALREVESNPGNWLQFLREDIRICGEIRGVAAKIKERLDFLRENKKIPGNDRDFRSLYSSYKKLIDERGRIFNKYAPYGDEMDQIASYYSRKIKDLTDSIAKEKQRLEILKATKYNDADERKDEIESVEAVINDYIDDLNRLKKEKYEAGEDLWQSQRLTSMNAIQFLRDAALYDYAFLKQKTNPDSYRNYLRLSKNREIEAMRWKALRGWIMSAKSETAMPVMAGGSRKIRMIEDGILAYSRSEIEEYMWEIDSTPVAGTLDLFGVGLEGGVVEELLQQNINGYHGVYIDKTEGIENIARNRDRMIIYSAITAFVAIVLAYILAGFLVIRIKKIISRVKLAGKGNLGIEFPEKGLDEIEDLGVSLNSMMHGLREKEEIKGEIAAAGEIQKTLLPEKIPENLEGYYSIGTFYRPMQGVGGDYYDFIQLDEESIFFCIADVSSHGVGPAIVMSMLRTHIHGILRRGIRELTEILLEVNRQIFIETPPHIFVTLFTGIVNKTSNEIEYCSAGHLKPLLYRYKKNDIAVLEAGGLPVGMDDNDIFSETLSIHKVQIKPGDVFFQYTDGLTEAMDSARNLFGDDRMYEQIMEYSRKKTDVLILKIAEAVEKFTGKIIVESIVSELNDDIAMIALKRLK